MQKIRNTEEIQQIRNAEEIHEIRHTEEIHTRLISIVSKPIFTAPVR